MVSESVKEKNEMSEEVGFFLFWRFVFVSI